MAVEKNGFATLTAQQARETGKRRRLADEILRAFDFACDHGDLEVAEMLLSVLEDMLVTRVVVPLKSRRHELKILTAAYERLRTIQPSPSRHS